jgi:hypothetical protein
MDTNTPTEQRTGWYFFDIVLKVRVSDYYPNISDLQQLEQWRKGVQIRYAGKLPKEHPLNAPPPEAFIPMRGSSYDDGQLTAAQVRELSEGFTKNIFQSDLQVADPLIINRRGREAFLAAARSYESP